MQLTHWWAEDARPRRPSGPGQKAVQAADAKRLGTLFGFAQPGQSQACLEVSPTGQGGPGYLRISTSSERTPNRHPRSRTL